MDQVFLAPSLRCVMTQAEAIDAGRYGVAGQRVLLVTNNAPIPELTPGPDEQDGFAAIATRFDRIVLFNAIIEPYHPLVWRPDDPGMWSATFREALGLTGDFGITLMMTPPVPPAAALAGLFPAAPIDVLGQSLDPRVPAAANQQSDTQLIPGQGWARMALRQLACEIEGRAMGPLQRRLRHGLTWLGALTYRPSVAKRSVRRDPS